MENRDDEEILETEESGEPNPTERPPDKRQVIIDAIDELKSQGLSLREASERVGLKRPNQYHQYKAAMQSGALPKKGYSPEEQTALLAEVDRLRVMPGMGVGKACKQVGISYFSYYDWRNARKKGKRYPNYTRANKEKAITAPKRVSDAPPIPIQLNFEPKGGNGEMHAEDKPLIIIMGKSSEVNAAISHLSQIYKR